MNDAQDGKPSDGKSAGSQLPVVWSPKLDAGESMADEFAADNAASSSADEAVKGTAGNSTDSTGAASSASQPSRFMFLAASVALAAAAGALAGSPSA
ncbi:MAG: hypothetical protein WBD95_28540, partial [Xanthobacteraceae bacterium]